MRFFEGDDLVLANLGAFASGLTVLFTGHRLADLVVGLAIGLYIVKETIEMSMRQESINKVVRLNVLFLPNSAATPIISLYFDFDFSNKLLGVALGGLFKQLCDSMVESFRKQAAVRYG